MRGRFKLRNPYYNAFDLLDKTPKAVIAAVVVSILSNGGEAFEQVAPRFLAEWRTLYDNGIVQQKPPGQAGKGGV
jgi:hypothetical protein